MHQAEVGGLAIAPFPLLNWAQVNTTNPLKRLDTVIFRTVRESLSCPFLPGTRLPCRPEEPGMKANAKSVVSLHNRTSRRL